MLAKKVDTLTKAMEVEAKKMRREVAAMEKEVAAMRVEKEQDNRAKRYANVKGAVSSAQPQLISGRYLYTFFLRYYLDQLDSVARFFHVILRPFSLEYEFIVKTCLIFFLVIL